VLVEGPSKTDPGRVSGRTRTNRLVHVPATPATVPGAFLPARITQAASHYLLGDVVADRPAGAIRIAG
jgi:tRNA-2-methylthio-N6-dimethylallyladenosine synthase